MSNPPTGLITTTTSSTGTPSLRSTAASLWFWGICKQILDAAKANDVSVFGYQPGNALVQWFNMTINGEPAPEVVEDNLRDLLQEAARRIKKEMKFATGYGLRQAKADVDYFISCDVKNEDLPWFGLDSWAGVPWPPKETDENEPFLVASTAWLRLVGL